MLNYLTSQSSIQKTLLCKATALHADAKNSRHLGLLTPNLSSKTSQAVAFWVPGAPRTAMRVPALMASSPEKKPMKRRGRPPKSQGKSQSQRALLGGCSAGKAFTPHVMLINQGEDITSKILSLSELCAKSVCVLSANGPVSTVTLHVSSDSCGNDNAVYQGNFEIISLNGSCLLSDENGSGIRTGGLSIIVSTPCGSIFGGSIGGPLIAADPVQVIAGSFNYKVTEEGKEAKDTECQLTDLKAPWELDAGPDEPFSPFPEFGWSRTEDANLGRYGINLTNC